MMVSNTQRIKAFEKRIKELNGLDKRVRDLSSEARNLGPTATQQQLATLAQDYANLLVRTVIIGLRNGQAALKDSLSDTTEDCHASITDLWEELVRMSTKRNLTIIAAKQANTRVNGGMEYGHLRAPEPIFYGGARDAKVLQNFLFDMEQYFRVVQTDSEEEKVAMATMYLSRDAKQWWRMKYKDIQSGKCSIETWDDLKKELNARFLLENFAYLVRRQLRELKQVGTVREYVKKFSRLMLDIKDMNEVDRLFYFLE
uniref:Retrotransposon gag domain-containing protein n=1 Tax=Cannabis sativa TaxID=3483 RepID=A0A803Q167_CANSA